MNFCLEWALRGSEPKIQSQQGILVHENSTKPSSYMTFIDQLLPAPPYCLRYLLTFWKA